VLDGHVNVSKAIYKKCADDLVFVEWEFADELRIVFIIDCGDSGPGKNTGIKFLPVNPLNHLF
jgi:hypothetical protein